MVLYRRADEMGAALAAPESLEAENRQVVRLGGAAREDDLVAAHIDHPGHVCARAFHRLPGDLSVGVRPASRVAEVHLGEAAQFGLYARIDGTGRRAVQIHWAGAFR